MSNFSSLCRRLKSNLKARPTQSDELIRQAAVALVLRRNFDEAELLVIKRAVVERDHWSGHLALPGGRKDERDADLQETAVRETREEVGIDISRGGEILGALDTIRPESPFAPRILVTPFVAIAPSEYHVLSSSDETKPLTLNREVAEAFWVPVYWLRERGRSELFRMAIEGGERTWPAYGLSQGLIWGITERILTSFLELIEPGVDA
ncbi:MAG TPA: CoA pyrophosphatase [Pyrinomonadaceae bacterium]|nr:CoA pyrophosphatase [Pyrinomonadaceae bacterium]